MSDRIEEAVSRIYAAWRSELPVPEEGHPGEEEIACFLEGGLPEQESRRLEAHLIKCPGCSELFAAALKIEQGII